MLRSLESVLKATRLRKTNKKQHDVPGYSHLLNGSGTA